MCLSKGYFNKLQYYNKQYGTFNTRNRVHIRLKNS